MSRVVEASKVEIRKAAAALRRGEVIAFPTETVYGLSADTFNLAALRKVYELKGRPRDNPLIAHVLDAAMARRSVAKWDERCDMLAQQFWPGPLALVLPKRPNVPALATGGLDTVAVRSPDHPVARALIAAFGGPISAPSANRSGRISPTRAAHVAAEFPEGELTILDGGPCARGVESTVLDLSREPARVLRPGSVSAASLAEALGATVEQPPIRSQAASPGTSSAHYAPATPLALVAGPIVASQLESFAGPVVVLTIRERIVPPPHELIEMPRDAEAYARELYHALRSADERGAAAIVVELPDESGDLWDAIRNRLERAAAGRDAPR